MGGTRAGGLKAAATNNQRYPGMYSDIGRRGGKISRGGGFASTLEGPDGLTGLQRASIAGSVGGKASRRGKARTPFIPNEDFVPNRFKDVD